MSFSRHSRWKAKQKKSKNNGFKKATRCASNFIPLFSGYEINANLFGAADLRVRVYRDPSTMCDDIPFFKTYA